MVERIKDRLDRGETVMTIGVGRILHHNIMQILGLSGAFHSVWFDAEHVGFTIESLEINALAARSEGLDNFVRIAPTDYATVTRALEAGGGGIMAAQVFSAEQAEEIVRWCKFHPRGNRSVDLYRRASAIYCRRRRLSRISGQGTCAPRRSPLKRSSCLQLRDGQPTQMDKVLF